MFGPVTTFKVLILVGYKLCLLNSLNLGNEIAVRKLICNQDLVSITMQLVPYYITFS